MWILFDAITSKSWKYVICELAIVNENKDFVTLKHNLLLICHQHVTKFNMDVIKILAILPFSIFISFEHLTIRSWCSMPEDEQRLSASPFEEYFWRDTKGMCSPEQAQYYRGQGIRVDRRKNLKLNLVVRWSWKQNNILHLIIFQVNVKTEPVVTVQSGPKSVRGWKIPEGAVNVPSFESADPAFNSTLLNGTIVFSILKLVSMLATNA